MRRASVGGPGLFGISALAHLIRSPRRWNVIIDIDSLERRNVPQDIYGFPPKRELNPPITA
jgi:hypothetical protein